MSAPILAGTTVLDLTRVMSGPYCTLQLADMGARVIKVEHPERGDDTRAWGPPFVAGESVYFLSVNRNKESLTLDFKQPEGREILDALIRRADVLVENFRPGTLGAVGLDYPSVATRAPRLIYTSISGYGHTGPLRHLPGYDAVSQAEGGLMSITGEVSGAPYRLGLPIVDLVSGMFAAQGILLALLGRHATGKGRHVDISMLDSVAGLLTYQAANFFATGENPPRMGNAHASIVPYGTFDVRDGQLMLAIGNDDQWKRFCQVAHASELAADQRFATNPQRVSQREILVALLTPILQSRDRDDWVTHLREAGVPCGPVRSIGEAVAEPQLSARAMITTLNHPKAGPLQFLTNPVKFDSNAANEYRPAPTLGQHTEAILTELGKSSAEVGELRKRRVV